MPKINGSWKLFKTYKRLLKWFPSTIRITGNGGRIHTIKIIFVLSEGKYPQAICRVVLESIFVTWRGFLHRSNCIMKSGFFNSRNQIQGKEWRITKTHRVWQDRMWACQKITTSLYAMHGGREGRFRNQMNIYWAVLFNFRYLTSLVELRGFSGVVFNLLGSLFETSVSTTNTILKQIQY